MGSNPVLDPVSEHRGLLRTKLQQGAQSFTGPPLGAGLHVAASQNQYRDDRRDLEVHLMPASLRRADELDAHPHPG